VSVSIRTISCISDPDGHLPEVAWNPQILPDEICRGATGATTATAAARLAGNAPPAEGN